MKRFLFQILLLVAFSSFAQHSIFGTFTPANDYKWLIAYHLKAGNQDYTADTAINR